MVQVPSTNTRMSHALTIRSGRRVIGAIHSWAPSQRRTVDAEFEIEANSTGMPVDLVPQLVDGREIRISRYDLYPAIMEEVFGTSEIIVLTDQFRPFSIREHWRGPALNPIGAPGSLLGEAGGLAGSLGLSGVQNAALSAQQSVQDPIGAAASSKVGQVVLGVFGAIAADIRIFEYTGCWFTDVGRTMDAKGDRVVSVEATLVWQGRRRLQ